MADSAKGTNKGYKVLTVKTVQDAKFEQVVTMNSKNIGNANPIVFGLLKATTTGVFDKVELGALDEEGNQAALAAAGPDSEGPIKLRVSPAGTTARFTMSRLVTQHPALKVPRGRVRKYPVSVSENGKFLVLDLKNSAVELAEGGTAPEVGKVTPQAAAPQGATGQVAAAQSEEEPELE